MFAKQLVKRFNEVHGTRYRSGNPEHEARIQDLVKEFGEAKLLEALDKTVKQTISLKEFLHPFTITRILDGTYLFTNQVQTELLDKDSTEEKEMTTSNNNSVGQAFGLLEQALASVMTTQHLPKFEKLVVEGSIEKVKQFIKDTYGVTEKVIQYKIPERGQILEVVHERFEEILQYVMLDEPVMLMGSAGTGKNVLVQQISKTLNLPFYFSNAVTQEYKITGFIDANGTFHETEFYKAFKNGGIFMLDEIDASIPEVLVILNAAIANRYFDFPNGRIDAHKEFRVIAAGNTYGTGANYQFVGRNQLDAASLDRFAIVEINYSPLIEEAMTNKKDLIEFIRDFRRVVEKNNIKHIVSYRSIKRIDKLASSLPLTSVLKSCLLKNLEQDDLRMIANEMKVMNDYTKALKELI
jgi:MoxR-like ATPase